MRFRVVLWIPCHSGNSWMMAELSLACRSSCSINRSGPGSEDRPDPENNEDQARCQTSSDYRHWCSHLADSNRLDSDSSADRSFWNRVERGSMRNRFSPETKDRWYAATERRSRQ